MKKNIYFGIKYKISPAISIPYSFTWIILTGQASATLLEESIREGGICKTETFRFTTDCNNVALPSFLDMRQPSGHQFVGNAVSTSVT